jgi:HEAT repeat protein
LFDGINELPSEAARRDLQQFRQQYPKIPMIFTTRDIGIGGDLNIEKKLEMLPLTEAQMQDFVKAYLPEKSEQMLKQLGTRLKEFGQTPLLLFMLCLVFKYENQIPANLGLVFQKFTTIYDQKLKQDVPTYQESRDWWRELLQILAWKMTQGNSKTEIQVAISQREAEAVLREYLQRKVAYPDNCAKQWLKDLLKHHLIQLESNNQIAFRHQLIQEYYTAEALLEKLPHLSDEELQWDYLNYLKWTETFVLMLALLEDEAEAIQVTKLAREVDLLLGARLGGAVKPEFQAQAIRFIEESDFSLELKIKLWEKTRSEQAIPRLLQALQNKDEDVRWSAANALGELRSEQAIPKLIQTIQDDDSYSVCQGAANALRIMGSQHEIPSSFQTLEYKELEHFKQITSALSETMWAEREQRSQELDYFFQILLDSLKNEQSITKLCQDLKHNDSQVRRKAVRTIVFLGNQSKQYITGWLQRLELEESIRFLKEAVELLQQEQVVLLEEAVVLWSNFLGDEQAIILQTVKNKYFDQILEKVLENLMSRQIIISRIISRIMSLIQALQDEDLVVCEEAALALGNLSNKKDFDQIAEKVLENLRSEQVITSLIQALQDEDSVVCQQAALALGDLGNEQAIIPLIQAVKDKDIDVQLSAGSALEQLGYEQAIPELYQILYDDNRPLLLITIKRIIDKCRIYNPEYCRPRSQFTMSNQVEAKLAEDGQNISTPTGKTSSSSSTQSQVKSESKYNIYAKSVQIIEQGDGKIQDSSS